MKLSQIYKSNSRYKSFLLSLLFIGLGYGLYKGVLDNYLANIVSMDSFDRGVTEFFRELPGFFLILILALFYRLSAQTIFRIGSLVTLIGLAMISFLPPEKVLVILAMTIYSTGEHIQLGMKNTLSLDYAAPGCGGASLGVMHALSEAGNIIGYIAVIGIFSLLPSSLGTFRMTFLMAVSLMALGGIAATTMGGKGKEQHKEVSRFYFRRKFGKFYALEVFYGARKQIFFTFGPYVLILFYHASTQLISALFAISAICCFIASPLIGRIIDRFGYRIVMIMDTLILVIVCFFYGFAHHFFPMPVALAICSFNYVLDSVISLASMASSVYVQDISSSREEVRATITTGISVNHFISILIALFGGWIWKTTGIEVLFTLSAILGIMNSIYAATIKTGRGKKEKGRRLVIDPR